MVRPRGYQATDYSRVIGFLSEVYSINGNQHSWLPARWEYAEYLVGPLYRFRGCPDWHTTIQIWETERGRIVGVVNSENPDENAYLQIHPDYRSIEEEMVEWAEANIAVPGADGANTRELVIWVHDNDPFRRGILGRRGYRQSEGCEFQTRMNLDAEVPPVELPEGYSIRSVAEGVDLDSRGEAVARAFNPSIDEHRISRQIEAYLMMRKAPSYRMDLDLVTVFHDTVVTSACIVWLDERNRTGYVEPVATHPDYQRKGLGRAVVLEGLKRLKNLGARVAYVNPYGEWRCRFYTAIGFTPYDTYRAWAKEFQR
ncbi:MAG: GNAT family N-acetyltransferase [Bacteroidota bacterium]